MICNQEKIVAVGGHSEDIRDNSVIKVPNVMKGEGRCAVDNKGYLGQYGVTGC